MVPRHKIVDYNLNFVVRAMLLEMDEFIREIAAGRILSGFNSLVPSFPPTFKRKRHQSLADVLDKTDVQLYSKPEPDDPISRFLSVLL